MDKGTAVTLGISVPALLFVVVQSSSGSIYALKNPVRPDAPAAEETVEEVAVVEEVTEDPVDAAPAPEVAAETEEATDDTTEVAALAPEPAEDDTPVAEAETSETGDTETAEAEPTEAAPEAADAAIDLAAIVAAGDPGAGERIYRQCSACHVVDREQNRVGPHLVDIIGRDIAAIDGVRYSDALLGLEGVWTAEKLSAWIEKPSDFAPGTRMNYRGLSDAQDRADLLAYLASLQE